MLKGRRLFSTEADRSVGVPSQRRSRRLSGTFRGGSESDESSNVTGIVKLHVVANSSVRTALISRARLGYPSTPTCP